jgi:signal transduction histidine kinase/FixJ family two-component response regulator
MATSNKTLDFPAGFKTLHSATDSFSEALFLIDQSDHIILANNVAQTMIGLPESALFGNPIATILSLQLSQQGTKPNRIKLPTADLMTLAARVHALTYSATFIPLAGLAYFADFKPRPTALVIVRPTPSHQSHGHTNTTIYVQLIGNLTMRIAHDLSNSLTSIIGNAELLEEQLNDLLTSPTSERIASLKDNGLPELHDVIRKSREMAQFINNLREYARQQPVNTHTLDLNNAVNETLAIARTLLGPKIQIDFLPADELLRIHMDRFRIDQLLLSILLSCKNGMPSGGPITIETERATLDREFTETHRGARPGTYTRVSIITNSSTGIDFEQVTRIFDFPEGQDFDLAGLGLPIVYSIVKRFGGYVTVETSKGTRFDIYIPSIPTMLSIFPIPDQERALDPLPLPESAANNSLILVADDDSDIQQTIARYVSRAGYKTAFAADGKTTLDLYKRLTTEGNQPVLLIADLGLPEIDGRTLSITLQQEFRSAKILLTSGYKIEINPTTGETPEGFTFLQKPFEPNALLTTIERLLKHKEPQNLSFKRSSSPADYKPRKHKNA